MSAIKSIKEAIEQAEGAFWAAMVAVFPVPTGDLDPGAAFRFSRAADEAARWWLMSNLPFGTRLLHEDGSCWTVAQVDGERMAVEEVDVSADARQAPVGRRVPLGELFRCENLKIEMLSI